SPGPERAGPAALRPPDDGDHARGGPPQAGGARARDRDGLRVSCSPPRVPRRPEEREEGCMIPGARPDLEHALPRLEAGLLEHDRDHRGRGDRLAGSDRQWDVLVSRGLVLRTDECLAGDREKGGSNPRILEVTRADEPVHHAHPLGREIDAPSHWATSDVRSGISLVLTPARGGRSTASRGIALRR